MGKQTIISETKTKKHKSLVLSESDEELEWIEYRLVHHSQRACICSREIFTGLAKKIFSSGKRKIRKEILLCLIFPLGKSYVDMKIEICIKKNMALI